MKLRIIKYESIFNDVEVYKENNELVKKEFLDDLSMVEFEYLINDDK